MATVQVTFKGLPELNRRLTALEELGPLMRDVALTAVAEQKKLAPVKTGNMRRAIHVGRVTNSSAETVAGAKYSGFVEFGTKAHEIRPRSRKALRWKAAGGVIFAKRVRHPGTRAQPFMVPGARAAISSVRDRIIALWDRAA
jgi:hypothetical protein